MTAHVIYKIPTKVKHLELKKRIISADTDRSKPISHDRPVPTGVTKVQEQVLGWYVHFEGSYESICVGMDKPDNLEPGTRVDILIIPRRKGT